jgi:chromosomal replication initiation ATPase DnaA
MQTEPATCIQTGANPVLRPARVEVEDVIALVAQHCQVPQSLIINHSRCRAEVAEARQIAMYLLHVVRGVSLTAIGRAFGRDRTTVSHACALIEDRRDRPAFDDMICALELAMQADHE